MHVSVVEDVTRTLRQARPPTVTSIVGGGVGKGPLLLDPGGYAVWKLVPVMVTNCPPLKMVAGATVEIVGTAMTYPLNTP
jgi:hypothetical protein